MPKALEANQAMHAYTRQQRTGLLARNRAQSTHPAAPPTSALLGTLLEVAVKWVENQAPEVRPEHREREAQALVGDFLSLVRRSPLPNRSCREQFMEYLEGAPPPSGNLGN